MARINRPIDRGRNRGLRKVSDEELARFLSRLARVYNDPRTGNPPLGEALDELANFVRRRVPPNGSHKSKKRSKIVQKPRKSTSPGLLSHSAILEFIYDESKTKQALIEFGISSVCYSASENDAPKGRRCSRNNPGCPDARGLVDHHLSRSPQGWVASPLLN
jgi:hypothetical protein